MTRDKRKRLSDGIEELKESINQCDIEDVPACLAALSALQLCLVDRLLHEPAKDVNMNEARMTIDEAAGFIRTSRDFLYRRWQEIPGAAKIGKRLTFTRQGLEKWMHQVSLERARDRRR